ncbi:formate C-acetyltransferase/glycerol dehydratase family glycyl radical enzyme [Candidatus Bathyarchaeota archaeon]|nr:MAG: formate C-acetyltransferase/glycerol dehydratase family glycyl radical enzyme [Candidatus Bathyarchaeota archaeon]
MTDRVKRLRERSMEVMPTISAERAKIITEFYKENLGKYPPPILRALAFKELCEKKEIYIGEDELIVGERGPGPKLVPTYPELTCHSLEDLEILSTREKTRYLVSEEVFRIYEEEIIPFWRGRSLRDKMFSLLPQEWKDAYEAGIFTEFMEQRAPGHTAGDGKLFRMGLLDFKEKIAAALSRLDLERDPEAYEKRVELIAMDIAADAMIAYARRHAQAARALAERASDPKRKHELLKIAEVCEWVPAHAPRNFWEALQGYWFYHLGVITELNGWDAFNPGHLDQHLFPFYRQDIESGALTPEEAKELLSCFWIKFNNQPAPPKVGVTAAESGTYNDFVNINLGGLTPDGKDGSNELSYLILEVADELHLLQPQVNLQVSRVTPDRLLEAACRVVRKGYGYPPMFNADMVVEELLRQGKSIEDAREGGTSGCVETGAFGKEAYILSGYFNLPKVLEITLNNGWDPRTKKRIGLETGDPRDFGNFDELFSAWERQLRHFIDIKIRGNAIVQGLYAAEMPAPFLSILIDDCIEKGKDYNAGGARYNTTYIQGVGIGTLTDSLSAIKHHVFEERTFTMGELLEALSSNFEGREPLRQVLLNKTPRYGNDDDRADELMRRAFDAFFQAVERRPAPRGGGYHINMLPTTVHIYFGQVTGATPDGRPAGRPLSEGISPVQGADRAGPTAVIKSVAKMDHAKTGGTLLNMKFSPQVLEGEEGIKKFARLIRTYFALGGHHVQFNVVSAEVLREAQQKPEEYRGLLVRVAGYTDYFCDLSRALQEEIISRTEHETI